MRRALLVAFLAACATHQAPREKRAPTPIIAWQIAIDPRFQLSERVCWDGFAPDGIEPELARVGGRRPTQGTSGCVDIALDLAELARTLDDDATLRRTGDALTGSFDAWLWRPHAWPKGLVGRLAVSLPPGFSLSLPNARAEDGRWLVPWSTWSFMARFAVGRFSIDTLDVAGARLSIANLGAGPRMSPDGVRAWLGTAATAVATVGDGRFPVPNVQVLLAPASRGDDPVVFGMAMRGGGASVSLRIADDATDANVRGDWIAVHELAHLWLPPIEHESAWLSEGVASYYQCVLRSRAGIYDEATAWEELLAGFARARSHPHGFMRTYWGGAAIAFELDVALRRRGSSLDRALVALAARHPDTVEELAHAVDRPAKDVLAELLAATGASDLDVGPWLEAPLPDATRELLALGIRGTADHVVLEEAPEAALRRAIAAPR